MEINSEPQSNKPLILATCPIKGYYEYIVTATYTGNNTQQSELCVYVFNSKSTKDSTKLLVKVPCSSKFSSIAWSSLGEDTQEHPLGYVLLGHSDGCVSLWDITEIVSNVNQENMPENFGMVKKEQLSNTEIYALSINDKPHIFAFASNFVGVASIKPQSLEISIAIQCEPLTEGLFSSLNWNPKVSYITASATTEGKVLVYNMKNGSLFTQIYDQQFLDEYLSANPNTTIDTKVIWNAEGSQVILAYDNAEYNYMIQYHMRQPNAPSAFYQNGHTNSIIDIQRNIIDPSYILTLGRDNVATCWSLRAGRLISQISLKEKCCHVVWANKIPDCIICVGLTGKIYVERFNFNEDMSVYSEGHETTPNWVGKKAGCSFAFGGKFYKFSKQHKGKIFISKISGNKALIQNIKTSNEKLEKEDLNEFLNMKISQSDADKQNSNLSYFWTALKSKYLNDTECFYSKCGFDKSAIEDASAVALGKNRKKLGNQRQVFQPQFDDNEDDVNTLFEEKPEIKETHISERKKSDVYEKPNTIKEDLELNINWNVGTEKLIKQCLITGNLENAVELLFKLNRNSEALLLASTQAELFQSASKNFFNKTKDLYVKSMFPAIIQNNFDLLFDYNYLKEWKEYLLYAYTYNKNDFKIFAEKLGDKLSNSPDIYSALVCYVMAENYHKTIDLLYQSYQKEAATKNDKKNLLQSIFEQTQCVYRILNGGKAHNDNYNSIIYDYCFFLIDEGLNIEASNYLLNLKGANSTIDELYDRVYYNCEYILSQTLPKPLSPYNIAPIRTSAKRHTNSYNNIQTFKSTQPAKYPHTSNVQRQVNPLRPPFRPSANNTITHPMMNQQQKAEQSKFENQPESRNINPPQSQHSEQPAKRQIIPQRAAPVVRPPAFRPINPPNRPQMKFNQNQANENTAKSESNTSLPHQVPRQPPHISNAPFQRNMPKMNVPEKTAFPRAEHVEQNEAKEEKAEMNKEEKKVFEYFENMIQVYNEVYQDDYKRKDFGSKVDVLLRKLENHEIKADLLILLIEFMNVNENSQNKQQDFKKLQWKIQSHDWDKNKSWMPLLGRLINMKRK